MSYSPTSTRLAPEDAAREELLRTFPTFPERIICDVFTAYRGVTATLRDATLATYLRLEDARAF